MHRLSACQTRGLRTRLAFFYLVGIWHERCTYGQRDLWYKCLVLEEVILIIVADQEQQPWYQYKMEPVRRFLMPTAHARIILDGTFNSKEGYYSPSFPPSLPPSLSLSLSPIHNHTLQVTDFPQNVRVSLLIHIMCIIIREHTN